MFSQHYLGNKGPTWLACNSEQVCAAIFEFSKNKDHFQNRQTYSRRILEVSQNFLNTGSVSLQI